MTLLAVDEKRGTIDTRFGRFELGPGDVVAMIEPLAGFANLPAIRAVVAPGNCAACVV